jgi:hypothetical protein
MNFTASGEESSTFTPETIVTSVTSVSYTSISSESTSVVPFTSDGTTGFTTITTVVVATSAVGTYTSASSYTTTPTALAGNESADSSSGLSSGAKAGIGVGVALVVIIAAAFGFWFSWYQRRKRRRSDEAASDMYPPSSLPAMTYGSGGRDYGGSALGGAAVGYTNRSDTRSELPSPPLGSPDPLLGGRAPDRLAPPAGGPVSWGSHSQQDPVSQGSVSDYSEYGGQQGAAVAGGAAAAGAGVATGAFADHGHPDAHELPENEHSGMYGGYTRTVSNGSQNQYQPQHQRTFSGGSQHNPMAGAVSPQTVHSRTMSDSSQQHAHAYHNSIGSDNPYAAELQASYPTSQQSAELEANLQQRMDYERKPVRPGHLLTKKQGDMDMSQNF